MKPILQPCLQADEPAQDAQPQQPILAVLSSNLPPIALGTFQGDMQRARIILEAAGFLIPFNVAASMLPADVRNNPHEPPGPAWGGLAEQWAAIQASQQAAEEEQVREEPLGSPNAGLPSPPGTLYGHCLLCCGVVCKAGLKKRNKASNSPYDLNLGLAQHPGISLAHTCCMLHLACCCMLCCLNGSCPV